MSLDSNNYCYNKKMKFDKRHIQTLVSFILVVSNTIGLFFLSYLFFVYLFDVLSFIELFAISAGLILIVQSYFKASIKKTNFSYNLIGMINLLYGIGLAIISLDIFLIDYALILSANLMIAIFIFIDIYGKKMVK